MSKEKTRLHLEKAISNLGMAVQPVLPTEQTPPFAYSVGQHAKGLPELIVFGLHPQVATGMLYALAAYMEGEHDAGRPVGPGTIHLEGLMCAALVDVPVEIASQYATFAHERGQGAATFLQPVWPDRDGKYPWQSGYDPVALKVQPVIGNPPEHPVGTLLH